MELVTFQIARKLEEKGFHYDKSKELDRVLISNVFFIPPIYRVLDWLREERGYHICIGYDGEYSYDVVRVKSCEFCGANDGYDSYEQAALAGIECVLDNLI
jgi:hypothetical protein